MDSKFGIGVLPQNFSLKPTSRSNSIGSSGGQEKNDPWLPGLPIEHTFKLIDTREVLKSRNRFFPQLFIRCCPRCQPCGCWLARHT